MTNTHNEAENGGQIIRRREGEIVEEEGQEVAWETEHP